MEQVNHSRNTRKKRKRGENNDENMIVNDLICIAIVGIEDPVRKEVCLYLNNFIIDCFCKDHICLFVFNTYFGSFRYQKQLKNVKNQVSSFEWLQEII